MQKNVDDNFWSHGLTLNFRCLWVILFIFFIFAANGLDCFNSFHSRYLQIGTSWVKVQNFQNPEL